jgi:hypothetical protein
MGNGYREVIHVVPAPPNFAAAGKKRAQRSVMARLDVVNVSPAIYFSTDCAVKRMEKWAAWAAWVRAGLTKQWVRW